MAQTQTPPAAPDKLAPGDGFFLLVVYLATFVAAFNENIVNVALPELCQDLAIGTDTGQWLITGYMVVASIMTASTGFLSRRFSTRGLFFTAVAALVAGELLCLVAPSYGMLLPCRLIQAVGSGILFPLMMNVVLACAPKPRLGLFLAVGTACITLGPALGPVLSGLADTLFGWRAIFVLPGVASLILGLLGLKAVRTVNVPEKVSLDVASLVLMACGLTVLVLGIGSVTSNPALGLLGLKAVRTVNVPEKVSLDVASLVLMACGLTVLVLGIGSVTSNPALGVALLVVAVVLLALFARRQFALETPLLNLRPFLNGAFWPAVLFTMVAMMMSFSLSVLLPLYYEGAFATTSFVAGLLILPAVAVNAGTSVWGGRIMDASGEWPLLPAGFALVLGALVVMVAMAEGGAGLVAVTLLTVAVYAGVGFVMSPSQTAGLRRLAPGEDQGGTAIINTSVMIAASIGSSLFVGVMTAATGSATSGGASEAAATATGFGAAMTVAAAFALAGLVGSSLFVGVMTAATGSATSGGASEAAATATGFGAAMTVAAAFALAGLVGAFFYARAMSASRVTAAAKPSDTKGPSGR